MMLDLEKMRSIEWHKRMEIACEWLWQMHKAGHLPLEVAEAFNHLFAENSYDISELIGRESLSPGAIPLEDFDHDIFFDADAAAAQSSAC
jgi:hypothetical protein